MSVITSWSFIFFFSSRRRHTRCSRDWSSDVCSSDLVWVPYASGLPPEILRHHDYHFSRVVARLRPDVSLANALSQVETVQYGLHLQNRNAPVAEDVAPRTLSDDLAQNVKKPLTVLLCAVGCMLLIGCLNVANLLVAQIGRAHV